MSLRFLTKNRLRFSMHSWLCSRPTTLVFGQRRALPLAAPACFLFFVTLRLLLRFRDIVQAKLRITQGIQQQGGTSLVALGGQVLSHAIASLLPPSLPFPLSYHPLFHSCTLSHVLVPVPARDHERLLSYGQVGGCRQRVRVEQGQHPSRVISLFYWTVPVMFACVAPPAVTPPPPPLLLLPPSPPSSQIRDQLFELCTAMSAAQSTLPQHCRQYNQVTPRTTNSLLSFHVTTLYTNKTRTNIQYCVVTGRRAGVS
jgi:hypothetical protein